MLPRHDLKRHLDQQSLWRRADLETELLNRVKDIFSLPVADASRPRLATDLRLDVVVSSFQCGEGVLAAIGEVGFPLGWRPALTLEGKVFNLDSGQPLSSHRVTIRTPWMDYFSRLLSVRAFFRLRPLFDEGDLERLLVLASVKLIEQLKQAIR